MVKVIVKKEAYVCRYISVGIQNTDCNKNNDNLLSSCHLKSISFNVVYGLSVRYIWGYHYNVYIQHGTALN